MGLHTILLDRQDPDRLFIAISAAGAFRTTDGDLANVNREVTVGVEGSPTLGSALDALKQSYPVLRSIIRDHITRERQPFIRYFACGEELSHEPEDYPLPTAVVNGEEPMRVVSALAGG